MMKPVLLDLFCGAGGATRGYQEAGFHVIGMDIQPQPHYCGDQFVQGDAIDYLDWAADLALFRRLEKVTWPPEAPAAAIQVLKESRFWQPTLDPANIAVIHASPPCHDHSALKAVSGADWTGWMLSVCQKLLPEIGPHWVIENVPGARMPGAVTVCGAAVGCHTDTENGRVWLKRHRQFQSDVLLLVPPCAHQGRRTIGCYGNGDGGGRGGKGRFKDRKQAMGIGWMNRKELGQAIPPAYTEMIGAQLIACLNQEGE